MERSLKNNTHPYRDHLKQFSKLVNKEKKTALRKMGLTPLPVSGMYGKNYLMLDFH